ncbi:MAG: ISLre2 family transposase [Clostridia bacterium]|nr:ISLre2 family transposase [Clostridia bacterium]
MENTKEIIQSLIDCAVNDIISLIVKDLKELNFSDIVRTTQKTVNNLGVNLIGQIVKIIDDSYNKKRDKHAVILRHTKTRKMVSAMGELNLTRRLYFNKTLGKYFFAVDELLNMEKYSRIESELKTKLINDATLTSYGKASKLSNGCVSRQTVHNLVKSVEPKSLEVQAKGLKAVKQIYIEADEDHIHLNNGKSAEVKLVYVHEGRQRVNRGRTALMGARYFVSVSNGSEIWDCVTDYLYAQYDIRNSEIHLSGDGANWIKQGLSVIPRAKYHLDKFHVYKSVTDATADDRRLRNQIINSIKLGDSKSVQSLYMQRWGGIGTAHARNRLYDSLQYIENNFDSIDLTAESNCSAEGHVSHVLSARLSSRPMAWSLAGAEKMAQLRAFYFNGGDFSELYQGRIKSEQVILNAYNVHAVRKDYEVDHSIPSGRIVGLDAVYDDVGRFLRYIVKK